MIKLICRSVNSGAAANIGGPVETRYVQFQIEHPTLEAWLKPIDKYESREVVGVLYEPNENALAKAGE